MSDMNVEQQARDTLTHAEKTGALTVLAQEVAIPNKLPELPEPIRTFAHEFATTPHKTRPVWAERYEVTPMTIRRWLKRKDVVGYILKVRYDRLARHEGALYNIAELALKKFQEILQYPVNDDNMATHLKAVGMVLGIGQGTKGEAGTVNVLNVIQKGQEKEEEVQAMQLPPGTSEKDQIRAMKEELSRWESVSDVEDAEVVESK